MLEHVDNLRHAIELSKSGAVQAYRKRYGNEQKRHRAQNSDIWNLKRVKVNRLEKVYGEYVNEFDSDDNRFFAFFAVRNPTDRQRSAAKKARHDVPVVYINLNKVAVAMGRCHKAIEEEQKKEQYKDDDQLFSLEKWHAQWGTINVWEVWRELGLE